MPTSSKPRKKYWPRAPVSADRIKAFRFNADADYWLKSHPHQALESMRSGTATADDYNTVSLRIRWGDRMIEDHIIEAEPREIMRQGIAALVSVGERFDRIGRFGLNGEEFRLLGDALNLADELQSTLTRREMKQSLRAVIGARDKQLRIHAKK